VLTGGDGWESHDVLNPSVISRPGPDPQTRRVPRPPPAPVLIYSGFDGRTWRTGLATSGDGTHWQKQGVILSPDARTWEGPYIAANGSALWYENQFWYWYQAGPRERPRIGLAARWIRTPGAKSQGPCLNRVRTEAGTSTAWPILTWCASSRISTSSISGRTRSPPAPGRGAFHGRRPLGETPRQPYPGTGRPRRVRRERSGRAGRMEFARLLLDALHRPRHQ